MSSSSQAGSSNDLVVVETDPSGQYVRYNKIIGKGAWKKIYLGFDKIDGIEIAWSITALTKKTKRKMKNHEMLRAEGGLLMALDHENILICYLTWITNGDRNKDKNIHMITELFTSGNLVHYANKHNLANNIRAIKIFSRQILRGLHYLHTHTPRIIHGNVKCENIFVNGNTGCVKLGNFGFATVLENEISETPEFTALVQEPYNPLVDIYSFGMCILQMVTRELPYINHDGNPAALSRVTDPEVVRFIKMCLADESERPTAIGLLNDPYLAPSVSGTLTASSSLSTRESLCNLVTSFFCWVVLLCQRQQEQEQEQEQEQRRESRNEVQRQQ